MRLCVHPHSTNSGENQTCDARSNAIVIRHGRMLDPLPPDQIHSNTDGLGLAARLAETKFQDVGESSPRGGAMLTHMTTGIVRLTGLIRPGRPGQNGGMSKPPDPHYRHRFPADLISHAVWLYHVFSLSFRDIELLLAERGVIVSYESVRQWCLKFGASFADKMRGGDPSRATNGTSMKCSFGSGASCTSCGAPLTRTGSCSISWCRAAAMRARRSVSCFPILNIGGAVI